MRWRQSCFPRPLALHPEGFLCFAGKSRRKFCPALLYRHGGACLNGRAFLFGVFIHPFPNIISTPGSGVSVVETAFGWIDDDSATRRLVTGVNWSPGILNPFRELGSYGQSLDTVLSQQRVARDEPVILVLHVACPRVEYTDRGKSAVVVGR